MTDQHRYTARPIDPDMERAALERAQQAAADSETAAAWYAAHSSVEKERDQYGREADRLRRDWTTMRDRAEQAEAVVARVREAAAWICRNYPGLTTANERLAAALDQPAATQATDGPKEQP